MGRTVTRRRRAPASRRLFAHDRGLGVRVVAGIDEAGRGCLAGPLVVAGVAIDLAALTPRARRALTMLDDSKRLSSDVRDAVADAIVRHLPAVVVASASPATIDRDGLHVTNQRLMREIAFRLAPCADAVLVDGRPVPDPMPAHRTVVGGDGISAAIAAASVIAKTTRDRLMRGPAATAHPAYGFPRHVGYATGDHRVAIDAHGPCRLHRMSYVTFARFCGEGGGAGE